MSDFWSETGMPLTANKSLASLRNPVAYDKGDPAFVPLPAAIDGNLILPVSSVVFGAQDMERRGQLVFHTVGDTGGLHGTQTQVALATAMAQQIGSAEAKNEAAPSFLYLLGDIVYNHGLNSMYAAQFYEPFTVYPAPIFAIPGNHDGDNRGSFDEEESSLYGFVRHFCDTSPRHRHPSRATMIQPNVYWTLDCPLATVVGLYSNVDEGSLDAPGKSAQEDWFIGQMRAASRNKALFIAVHHPPYSFDTVHGGSPGIGEAIDRAIQASGRMPDAIFSGHVHSYQRFERTRNGKVIPYIVAGAGGFANTDASLHKVQELGQLRVPLQTALPEVTLQKFNETDPGFLRITVEATHFVIEYFVVPFRQDGHATPQLFDAVTYQLQP